MLPLLPPAQTPAPLGSRVLHSPLSKCFIRTNQTCSPTYVVIFGYNNIHIQSFTHGCMSWLLLLHYSCISYVKVSTYVSVCTDHMNDPLPPNSTNAILPNPFRQLQTSPSADMNDSSPQTMTVPIFSHSCLNTLLLIR